MSFRAAMTAAGKVAARILLPPGRQFCGQACHPQAFWPSVACGSKVIFTVQFPHQSGNRPDPRSEDITIISLGPCAEISAANRQSNDIWRTCRRHIKLSCFQQHGKKLDIWIIPDLRERSFPAHFQKRALPPELIGMHLPSQEIQPIPLPELLPSLKLQKLRKPFRLFQGFSRARRIQR